MIAKSINEIVEPDIQELKDAGIEEGKTIEYKRELPGTKDEDKREFLADISSFSNTEGGDVIYGVHEDQGLITDIVGLQSPDFDAEILRLENLIRDGISPRIGAACRLVPCAAGKLLIIRIEKSWLGPHRVVFRGQDKFYARTSAGKFALDVSQLRNAFLQSAGLSEQINDFRIDRIIDIANDRAPVALAKRPTLALHIVPLGALSEQQLYDVTAFHRDPILHQPWGGSSWDRKMTFDGALLFGNPDADGKIALYTHFYRNGIVEAVTTMLLETRQVAGQRLIPHVALEESVLKYLPKCFESLWHLGVRPPVMVSLTLIGVRGLRMAMGGVNFDYGSEIREENLMIPGTLVESFAASAARILKPMFDRVWNACGLLESRNFDTLGNWSPRRGT
jgi:hypothetical protein